MVDLIVLFFFLKRHFIYKRVVQSISLSQFDLIFHFPILFQKVNKYFGNLEAMGVRTDRDPT
jgi:hypothetical protein